MDTNQVFSHTHLIRTATKQVCFDALYTCLFTVEPLYDGDGQIGHEAHVFVVRVAATVDGLPGLFEVAPRSVPLSPRNKAEFQFRQMLAAECLTAWADGQAAEHTPGPAQGKTLSHSITNEAAPALAAAA